MKKKLLIVFLLVFSGLLGLILSLYRHGGVLVASPVPLETPTIQTFHSPALFVKQIENDPDAGRKIFKEFCAVCHDKQPQIDVSAPRINDKKTWNSLRQWGKSQLLQITINGRGAMPARGGCFECSDEQLQMAIQYMMDQSVVSH